MEPTRTQWNHLDLAEFRKQLGNVLMPFGISMTRNAVFLVAPDGCVARSTGDLGYGETLEGFNFFGCGVSIFIAMT